MTESVFLWPAKTLARLSSLTLFTGDYVTKVH